MGNKPSERENDGRLSEGGPQAGPIGGTDDKRHIQSDTEIGATGGIGAGELGQGGQRHQGGSSRDSEKQR